KAENFYFREFLPKIKSVHLKLQFFFFKRNIAIQTQHPDIFCSPETVPTARAGIFPRTAGLPGSWLCRIPIWFVPNVPLPLPFRLPYKLDILKSILDYKIQRVLRGKSDRPSVFWMPLNLQMPHHFCYCFKFFIVVTPPVGRI